MRQHIALITGGSRGLGKNAALKLAERGIGVVITWQRQEQEAMKVVSEIIKNGGVAEAIQLDVGEPAGFSRFTETFAKTLRQRWQRETFDYLVNNAGTGLHTPFTQTSEAQFDALMAVHLKGPFFLTQKLLPMMEDGGHILNVTSGLTRFTLPGASAYATMKGALEILTRYLAQELGARGIRVNAIAPGAVATDFNGGKTRDNPQVNQMIAERTALGRVGLPDDIGDAVAALLSGELSWMTAQRVEVSGGMFL